MTKFEKLVLRSLYWMLKTRLSMHPDDRVDIEQILKDIDKEFRP